MPVRGDKVGQEPALDPQPSETAAEQHREEIEHLSEVARNGRKTFVFVLLGCLYTLLAILTTSDAELLTNTKQLSLPLIGGQMPVVWFYSVAPLLLLSVFFYLHLYLMRLWRGVVRLPRVHADGRSVDDYVYPWIISSALLRAKLKGLDHVRRPFSYVESTLSILLAWGAVPITLALLWLRFLTRHQWLASLFHSVMLAISIVAAIRLYQNAVGFLKQEPPEAGGLRERRTWLHFGGSATIFGAVLVTVVYLSQGAVKGAPSAHCADVSNRSPQADQANAGDCPRRYERDECSLLYAGARVLGRVGLSPFAQLDKVRLSARSSDWTGIHEELEQEIQNTEGAVLTNANLRHASAAEVFLVGADLRSSEMSWAVLSRAQLQGASLQRATLRGAYLDEAFLQYANLDYAHLEGATLDKARLNGAHLTSTCFQNAILRDASLEKASGRSADFSGAELKSAKLALAKFDGAIFDDARLQKADMKGISLAGRASLRGAKLDEAVLAPYVDEVRGRQEAVLSTADLRGASLTDATLIEAQLIKAKLEDADLTEAVMTEADLKEARLNRANLSGANMRGAQAYRAKLQGAQLTNATLDDAYFKLADLTEARLDKTSMLGTKFGRAVLAQADLTGAIAEGADFFEADLTEAKLTRARLAGAKLTGAVLAGADLSRAQGLTQGALQGSCGDARTLLPEGLTVEPCPQPPGATR